MVDENLKQRRGKNIVASATATTSRDTTTEEENKPTPLEQMRCAQARLIVSRDRTADLHAAWRGQLFRFSLLVVVVTMYQLKASLTACIRDIKDREGTIAISFEAIKILFGDSYCELMGVVISSLLAYFLALGYNNGLVLESWPYVLSTALAPICVGLFFNTTQVGCRGGEDLDMGGVDDKRHQFPAVILWHTVVTGAYWFMKSGMQECEDNVKLCTQSIEDFEIMDKKMALRAAKLNTVKKK